MAIAATTTAAISAARRTGEPLANESPDDEEPAEACTSARPAVSLTRVSSWKTRGCESATGALGFFDDPLLGDLFRLLLIARTPPDTSFFGIGKHRETPDHASSERPEPAPRGCGASPVVRKRQSG